MIVQNLELAGKTTKVPKPPQKLLKTMKGGEKVDFCWFSRVFQNEEKLRMMPQVS